MSNGKGTRTMQTPVEQFTLRAPDAVLENGRIETGKYGNRYDGVSDSDGVLAFHFDSDGEDTVLSFSGYDIDHGSEVEVFVNGISLGYISGGVNNGLADYQLLISSDLLIDGTNDASRPSPGHGDAAGRPSGTGRERRGEDDGNSRSGRQSRLRRTNRHPDAGSSLPAHPRRHG